MLNCSWDASQLHNIWNLKNNVTELVTDRIPPNEIIIFAPLGNNIKYYTDQ
jgi:hypothetical protein